MLFLLLILSFGGVGSARADTVQHGGIRFDLPAPGAEPASGDSSSGSSDASAGEAYGTCLWARPCRPPPGYGCKAMAQGKTDLTEKECHAACAAEGVDLQNQSRRNGTCQWHRNADGKKQPPGAAPPKRASCHLHIPRAEGPAESSVAAPRSLEECEADCERGKLFELVGARCEWRSAEGEKVRIK